MSQENLDLVRRGYESLIRRDFAAAFERVAPDFELDLSSLYPDAPVLRGADELMRWVYSGPWGGSVRLAPERFFDVDAERVLVFVRVTARGEGSGVPVELRDAHELTIRDGLLVRCKVHLNRDAALEAVGLSEPAMSHENVELVRRLFPPDGTDIVPLVRDEATWTTRSGEMEALIESDYAVAWIAEGQRMIEATGQADSRRGWLDWLEPWDTYRFQSEGIIPVGDTVVVLLRVHGRMAGTQNEVEMISASVYLVRDGRVARVEHYADRAAALEAVGLSEQDAHADS